MYLKIKINSFEKNKCAINWLINIMLLLLLSLLLLLYHQLLVIVVYWFSFSSWFMRKVGNKFCGLIKFKFNIKILKLKIIKKIVIYQNYNCFPIFKNFIISKWQPTGHLNFGIYNYRNNITRFNISLDK